MPDPFLQAVLKTIGRRSLFAPGETVVAAVSGGPDSVALLRSLHELSPALDIRVEAAHFNHRLRASESDEDEAFVAELCRSLGVQLRIGKPPEPLRRRGTTAGNLEDRARAERYEFLLSLSDEANSVVATGHTRNDQAETLILKLLRGAGISGLSGIYPLRSNVLDSGRTVKVARPLIDVERSQILDYLHRVGQQYRLDSSNRDETFDRNWVRHTLIPLLENKFHRKVVEVLSATAESMRETEELVAQVTEQAFKTCLSPAEPGEVVLSIDSLRKLHPALQKETIRRAFRQIKGDLKDVHRDNVDDTLRRIEGESGRTVHLPGGIRAGREFDKLVFRRPEVTRPFSYTIDLPGLVRVSEVAKVIEIRPVGSRGEDSAILPDRGWSRLEVRNRRPGDTFRMSGRASRRKLKEILIERQVPRSIRDRLLVLAEGDEIVWVEGLGIAHDFRETRDAERSFEILVEYETFCRERLLNL